MSVSPLSLVELNERSWKRTGVGLGEELRRTSTSLSLVRSVESRKVSASLRQVQTPAHTLEALHGQVVLLDGEGAQGERADRRRLLENCVDGGFGGLALAVVSRDWLVRRGWLVGKCEGEDGRRRSSSLLPSRDCRNPLVGLTPGQVEFDALEQEILSNGAPTTGEHAALEGSEVTFVGRRVVRLGCQLEDVLKELGGESSGVAASLERAESTGGQQRSLSWERSAYRFLLTASVSCSSQ